MEDKINILQALDYYLATRPRVGHTYTMLEGLKNNPKAKVITVTNHHGELLQQQAGQKISWVSLASFTEDGSLCGLQSPIVLDNYTLHQILNQSLAYIAELERKLALARMPVTAIKDI